jgi:carbon monoxide dehydrogenase subunit G
MSITLNLKLGYEFEVHASAKNVFDVLADVPTSASFYPKVDQLVDLGGGVYRWEMEKIGVASVTLQTVYASKYVANRAKGTVVWTPVEGAGNALVSGSWQITNHPKSTQVVLSVQAAITLPLPALMTLVVSPVVEAEFEHLTDQYIANLIARFGGEA